MAENFSNDFATELASGINDSTASLTVVASAGSPDVNFRIRIDNELMLVTGKGGGTDWTVTRGIEGTVAAAHSGGAIVVHVVTTGGLEQYIEENGGGGVIKTNPISITEDTTLADNTNGMTAGPIEIGTSVTVTIGSGSTWTVV